MRELGFHLSLTTLLSGDVLMYVVRTGDHKNAIVRINKMLLFDLRFIKESDFELMVLFVS